MDPAPSPLTPAQEEPAYRVFLDSLDYLAPADVERIKAAYAYAERAHANQKRMSGEAYITHPLAVAGAVVEWRMDADAVAAALLHDVLEDTGTTKRELAEKFGKEVAELVDGLSKLDKMEFASYQEAQAENFRKMLMAMARDLRVVLIKLADRQHNLQTMSAMRLDKRARIARETLEIYAPIALRLGLNKLYRELQDTSFRLIYPHRAEVLTRALKYARGNRSELLTLILDGIKNKLSHAGLKAEVFGREKSLYSIFRKMKEKRLSFSQVLDIYGFRVVVENVPTCYLAIGALHGLFKPVPGKFKDYIAIPKANGYQSLHTTLIGPYGTPVEVQVRTRDMHNVAQEGVAAHWLYKDSEDTGADLQVKTHKWLQSLLEMQGNDSAEFFENVKIDLFPDEVYIFTPKGKIMAMPRGATVIDFAYAVHTDVGHHCSAARVNQELAPLRTELRNGDLVEIVTSTQASPNPVWLTYVKTGRARSKIRHFLRTMQNEESARLGERLLRQELLSLGVVPISIPAEAWDQMVKAGGQKSMEDVYTEIGLGKRLPSVVARRLLARENMVPDMPSNMTLAIHGTEGMAIQLARCCQPIPGDPIIGSIKKGSGLVIHTHDCPTIRKSRSSEPQKWIDVEWEPEEGKLFDIRIGIEVKNTRGVLAQVAAAIAEAGSNIEHVSMDADPERLFTVLRFTIQVAHRNHLAAVMRGMRHIPEVTRIVRERGGEV
ncbi:MAG: bifunctional (p)ppGpp synthetase/guanosine-3',5'-bis(diphosphate) 3'-pyrophosphohydrolase [Azonexus sp.]|nr:bifunctional (p)ppGpp synthetase/guanosine-3',5'-bis(diphosphate) 3'-pyrophosphohydrolase [Azonexus sp.]